MAKASVRTAVHDPIRRFPPPGPRGASSPTSTVLSADSDFSTPVPPHFVSFAWRYHAAALFAPAGVGRSPGRDCCLSRPSVPHLRWRRRDLPGSWATPACMPRSPTPAEPHAPDHLGAAMVPSALVTASASAMRTISWLNHAACKASCVRFADSVTTAHATLGSGWLVNLGRSGLAPAGSLRRFPSLHITSPFTKLRLAQDKPVPYRSCRAARQSAQLSRTSPNPATSGARWASYACQCVLASR